MFLKILPMASMVIIFLLTLDDTRDHLNKEGTELVRQPIEPGRMQVLVQQFLQINQLHLMPLLQKIQVLHQLHLLLQQTELLLSILQLVQLFSLPRKYMMNSVPIPCTTMKKLEVMGRQLSVVINAECCLFQRATRKEI